MNTSSSLSSARKLGPATSGADSITGMNAAGAERMAAATLVAGPSATGQRLMGSANPNGRGAEGYGQSSPTYPFTTV